MEDEDSDSDETGDFTKKKKDRNYQRLQSILEENALRQNSESAGSQFTVTMGDDRSTSMLSYMRMQSQITMKLRAPDAYNETQS